MKQADMPASQLTKRQHAELEILKSLCINKRETQPMKHLVDDAKKLAGLLIESWESENNA